MDNSNIKALSEKADITIQGFSFIGHENPKPRAEKMKPIKITMLISLILITFGIVSAEIYTWVDENGVTHYSDSPTTDSLPDDLKGEEVPRERREIAATPEQPAPTSRQQERKELMESISKLLEDADPPVAKAEEVVPVELYVTDT